MLETNTGAPSGAPDLVWLNHRPDNEELRYSIRSVARNTPHNKLWVAGVMPEWGANLGHIPVECPAEKFASMRAKAVAIANCDELTPQVVILQDDMYLMGLITRWNAYHLGSTESYLAQLARNGKTEKRNTWVRAVNNVHKWLGHDTNAYIGHTPLLFDRAKLTKALAEYPTELTCDYPMFYTLAGAGGEGVLAHNAKVASTGLDELLEKAQDPRHPWLSSNDVSFSTGMVGGYIRGAFRAPSPYERTVE